MTTPRFILSPIHMGVNPICEGTFVSRWRWKGWDARKRWDGLEWAVREWVRPALRQVAGYIRRYRWNNWLGGGREIRCDVRIALCFALLSDPNALWYDHSTSSVR